MPTKKPAYLVGSLILPQGHPSLLVYGKACQSIFQAHGAEVLIVGTSNQQIEALEGHWTTCDAKLSVVKFPSMQQLKGCLNSDAYQAIKHLRNDALATDFSLAIE